MLVIKNQVGAIKCDFCKTWSVLPTIFANKHFLEYSFEKIAEWLSLNYIPEPLEDFLLKHSKAVEVWCCFRCNTKYGVRN